VRVCEFIHFFFPLDSSNRRPFAGDVKMDGAQLPAFKQTTYNTFIFSLQDAYIGIFRGFMHTRLIHHTAHSGSFARRSSLLLLRFFFFHTHFRGAKKPLTGDVCPAVRRRHRIKRCGVSPLVSRQLDFVRQTFLGIKLKRMRMRGEDVIIFVPVPCTLCPAARIAAIILARALALKRRRLVSFVRSGIMMCLPV
jgi:hypothetical protein